jgi:diaminopimelate epimerase
MTAIRFTKMVGAGNDFVVVDTVRHPQPSLAPRWRAISQAVCDRHAGIGADGLLVLQRSRAAQVRMRVFNPDGSEAEMCGNGARCVALYLAGQGSGRRGRSPVTIETSAGIVRAQVRGNRVAMRLADPTALRLGLTLTAADRTFRLGCVNTGVPHAVVPVERLEAVDVARIGRALRHHRAFAPRGSNVNFIQADPRRPHRLRIRTYERGVEQETLACGTGAAASAVVFALRHGPRRNGSGSHRIDVETRSRDVLTVSFRVQRRGGEMRVTDLVLRGSAAFVFEGTITWPMRGVR